MKSELRQQYDDEMKLLPYGKQINYEQWLESQILKREQIAFEAGRKIWFIHPVTGDIKSFVKTPERAKYQSFEDWIPERFILS